MNQHDLEKAIIFSAKKIEETCRNEKPVLLHSTRVAFSVLKHHKDYELAISAALHDLIEDTDCTEKEIRDQFGEKVADLVLANTFDTSISDYKERWRYSVEKLIKTGKDAMIIKLHDLSDNLPYCTRIKDPSLKEKVIWKHEFAVKSFEPYFKDDSFFAKYKHTVQNTKK